LIFTETGIFNMGTTSQRSGFLTPTFMSVAVAGVSGVIAAQSDAAANLVMGDKVMLGLMVAGGTFLAAKIGMGLLALAGGATGAAVGGLFGAGAGAAAGSTTKNPSLRKDRMLSGGAFGGLAGAAVGGSVLAITGALVGFWGGAVVGHDLTTQVALTHVFKTETAAPKASIPAPAQFLSTKQPQFSFR
jgi:hypothetical protein